MASSLPAIKPEFPPEDAFPSSDTLRQYLESQIDNVSPVVSNNLRILLSSSLLTSTHLRFLCSLFELSTPTGLFSSSISPVLENDLLDLHHTFGATATNLLRLFVADTLGSKQNKREQLDTEAMEMVQSIKKTYDEYMKVRRLLESKKGYEYGFDRGQAIMDMGRSYNAWYDRKRDLEDIRDQIDTVRLSLESLTGLAERFGKLGQ